MSLWKSVQIAGSYRQRHVEAYIHLNIFHTAILNPSGVLILSRFYFVKHQLNVHKSNFKPGTKQTIRSWLSKVLELAGIQAPGDSTRAAAATLVGRIMAQNR